MARKTGSFQQHYLVTLARQQGGGGAAAWAAADHEHVSGQVWGVRLDHCHTFGYFSLALWAREHRVQGGAKHALRFDLRRSIPRPAVGILGGDGGGLETRAGGGVHLKGAR